MQCVPRLWNPRISRFRGIPWRKTLLVAQAFFAIAERLSAWLSAWLERRPVLVYLSQGGWRFVKGISDKERREILGLFSSLTIAFVVIVPWSTELSAPASAQGQGRIPYRSTGAGMWFFLRDSNFNLMILYFLLLCHSPILYGRASSSSACSQSLAIVGRKKITRMQFSETNALNAVPRWKD